MRSDAWISSPDDACRIEVVTAEAALAGGLLISLAHTFGRVSFENGYSWFGTQKAALVPYTLSMLVAAGLLARAAPMTHGPTRALLRLMAPALVGLTITPYSVSGPFNAVHMTLGSLLFVAQLGWTLWLSITTRERRDACLFAAEFAGGLVCFTSVLGYDTAMLWGQIVFQIAFFAALSGAASISRSRGNPASAPYRHSVPTRRPAAATGLPAAGGSARRSCPQS